MLLAFRMDYHCYYCFFCCCAASSTTNRRRRCSRRTGHARPRAEHRTSGSPDAAGALGHVRAIVEAPAAVRFGPLPQPRLRGARDRGVGAVRRPSAATTHRPARQVYRSNPPRRCRRVAQPNAASPAPPARGQRGHAANRLRVVARRARFIARRARRRASLTRHSRVVVHTSCTCPSPRGSARARVRENGASVAATRARRARSVAG